MQYLNLGLSRISIDNLIIKSKDVLENIKDNPHFSSTYDRYSEIDSIISNLEEFNSLVDAGEIGYILKLQSQFKLLKKAMYEIGKHVAIQSRGNAEIAKTSGFEVSNQYVSNEDLAITL